jgi:hypothetical protein
VGPGRKSFRNFASGLLLLTAAGCAETVYSDADEGTTRDLRQGSSFGVSLPAGMAPAGGAPKIEGALVRYLGRQVEEGKGREIFRFSADGAGEALIRIPSNDPAPQSPPAFVIRLRITPAAEHHVDWEHSSPPQQRPY